MPWRILGKSVAEMRIYRESRDAESLGIPQAHDFPTLSVLARRSDDYGPKFCFGDCSLANGITPRKCAALGWAVSVGIHLSFVYTGRESSPV